MKLSKILVDALASKIHSEIQAENKSINQAIRNSSEYVYFFKKNKKCIALIKLFPDCLTEDDNINYSARKLMEHIRSKHFNDRLKNINYKSLDDIKNEILISSIESSDLDSLVESIKLKFK